jgi:hypothetical protein
MARRARRKTDEERPPLPSPTTPARQRALLEELGTSGLRRQTGWVYEEFLPELQGPRGVRVYREMADNSPIVGAYLFALDQVILSASWTWRPASEENVALRVRDFFAEAVEDMSHTWRDFLSEILSMFPFGWALTEVVYKIRRGPGQRDPALRSKYDDGRWGWRKLPLRAQESLMQWEWDAEGGVRGMVQLAPPDFKERFVPIEKALLFRTRQTKNNPEGRSLLRNAYRPWYFGKRIEEIEAIGIERDLAGLPVFTPPEGYDLMAPQNLAEVELVRKILRNVRRDEQEGVLKPAGWEFVLLSTGGRRAIDTDAVVSRYNKAMALTVLAQFLLLGMENVGSKALAVTHEDLFLMAVGGWLHGIAAVINRHLVPRLATLNAFPPETWPAAVPSEVREPKVADLGKFVADLVNAGALSVDEGLERALRAMAKLPEKAEEVAKAALTRKALAEEERRAANGEGRTQVGILDVDLDET